ncbi:thioesterase family protein [Microbacterium istanbulense]|uniref:Thioesterase family protein n=1 Tax=Microbacterium istanbulense TaxID=3122049 RepID=A0ABU8LKV0_9MICO
MSSYFLRQSETSFVPTEHVGGAWKEDEQHVSPVFGLLAHLVETDHARRRPDAPLVLARASYDILGVIPMAAFDVDIRVLRPGRTIELVEATVTQNDRSALVLRAWMLQTGDTGALAGSPLPVMPGRDVVDGPGFDEVWPGGAVRSVEMRRQRIEPGRAHCWLRPRVPILEGERVSARARLLGASDFANGIATRVPPEQALYPNVDLTASLFREPVGEWIGLDTTVVFGADGTGLTETILNDERGPVGTSSQTLTVRPRPTAP